ncbi:hypothetical protein C0993_000585, partial [Termitomyces sp. T159_Od127]
EVQEECQAGVQECAAIQACRADHLPFADLDLLYSLLLALPHREALCKDDQSSGRAPEDKLEGEFHGIHHSEFPDKVVEAGDQIYATTLCLPLPIKEIRASQTFFQQLAQAFATNSPPR